MKQVEADQWVPLILAQLEQGNRFRMSPSGVSMCPFFLGGRDEIILERITKPLRTNQVVLYRREDGTHVVHRIHHCNETGYYLLGDSQQYIEGPIKREQILAIVTMIIRKGNEICCENWWYRGLAYGFMKIRPLRPYVFWLHSYVKWIRGGARSDESKV